MPDWPQVILLNGCSSAGKSSLTTALQAELPEPYMRIGLDSFVFEGAPLRWLGTEDGIRFETGEDGRTVVEMGQGALLMQRAFHRAVRASVDVGVRMIVDEAILRRDMFEDWAAALRGVDACFVGVLCDLEELERREKARRDRAKGMVRWQFEVVHAFSPYDLTVDTTHTPTSLCALGLVSALPGRPVPGVLAKVGA